MSASPATIRDLVEPALTSSGLELWDVEVSPGVVRVLVDRPGGIDLDSLATVAGRVVSPLLEEHPEAVPTGHYHLEVSSPGVERTLRSIDHYRRFVGSEVSVKTTVPLHGARRHHGTLLAVDAEGIRIEPKDAAPGAVVELPHDRIDRARTVLAWGSGVGKAGAAKPGVGKAGAGKPGPGARARAKRSAGRTPATDQPKDALK